MLFPTIRALMKTQHLLTEIGRIGVFRHPRELLFSVTDYDNGGAPELLWIRAPLRHVLANEFVQGRIFTRWKKRRQTCNYRRLDVIVVIARCSFATLKQTEIAWFAGVRPVTIKALGRDARLHSAMRRIGKCKSRLIMTTTFTLSCQTSHR